MREVIARLILSSGKATGDYYNFFQLNKNIKKYWGWGHDWIELKLRVGFLQHWANILRHLLQCAKFGLCCRPAYLFFYIFTTKSELLIMLGKILKSISFKIWMLFYIIRIWTFCVHFVYYYLRSRNFVVLLRFRPKSHILLRKSCW